MLNKMLSFIYLKFTLNLLFSPRKKSFFLPFIIKHNYIKQDY